MAVEAQNAVKDVLPKAIHHRHDDNECGHAERDTGKRKADNDRDKTLLTPRPQIAGGNHAFEGTEDHGVILARIDATSSFLREQSEARESRVTRLGLCGDMGICHSLQSFVTLDARHMPGMTKSERTRSCYFLNRCRQLREGGIGGK